MLRFAAFAAFQRIWVGSLRDYSRNAHMMGGVLDPTCGHMMGGVLGFIPVKASWANSKTCFGARLFTPAS